MPGGGQHCSFPNGAATDSPLHFTGQPRDSETGLDSFGFRYNSSSLGRWMTPDWAAAPEAVPYADLSDPQTLNLYAYAQNNPVTRTDPDGHTPLDDAWLQSGHDMQEVGFGFHLWAGQVKGVAHGPRALASGPAVALPTLFEGGERVLTVRGALTALDPAMLLALDGMLFIQDSYRFYQLGEAYGWWHGPTVLPPPVLFSKGGKKNVRHTAFEGMSDQEIDRLAKDKTAPKDIREKAVQEQKARRRRNVQKRRP